MQVNRIQSNNYPKQPSFGALRLNGRAEEALTRKFDGKQLKQIIKWVDEMKDAKHFDLEIDSQDGLDFSTRIKHHANHLLDTRSKLEAPWLQYDKIYATGTSLTDMKPINYILRFATSEEAKKAYKSLMDADQEEFRYFDRYRNFQSLETSRDSMFASLKGMVTSAKILDKSAEYTEKNFVGTFHPMLPKETAVIQPKNMQTTTDTLKSLRAASETIESVDLG